jgi:hypothetical protein
VGDDRQSTPCRSFRTEREDVRLPAASGIADAEGKSVTDELELQFDPVALAAPVQDRVRNQLARHEQNVLHALPVDPAPVKCASQLLPRLADRLWVGTEGHRPLQGFTNLS